MQTLLRILAATTLMCGSCAQLEGGIIQYGLHVTSANAAAAVDSQTSLPDVPPGPSLRCFLTAGDMLPVSVVGSTSTLTYVSAALSACMVWLASRTSQQLYLPGENLYVSPEIGALILPILIL